MRPPRPFVQRKCGIKIGYATYADAFRVAKDHWKYYREKLLPYQCPLCGRYHIGHQRVETELSTAFVPLVQPKPKNPPKLEKIVKEHTEIRHLWVNSNRDKQPKKVKPKSQPSDAKQRRNQIRHEEHQRIISKSWQIACDDGWNQHQ